MRNSERFLYLIVLATVLGVKQHKSLLCPIPYLDATNLLTSESLGGMPTRSTRSTNAAAFNETWPDLKVRLCPNMVPNTDFGPTLFSLARREIGMQDLSAGEQDKEPVFKRLFDWHFGGSVYTSPDDESTVYVTIWKSGNDQIRVGSANLFEGQPGKYISFRRTKQLFEPFKDENLRTKACFVTAVRDPVSHFLSRYNHVEVEKRIENPHNLLYSRYKPGSKQRFEQFVADFVGGPTRAGLNYKFLQQEHFFGMSGFLVVMNKQGLKLTSYLTSIANIAETWGKFIGTTCRGIPEESTARSLGQVEEHSSSSDEKGIYRAAKEVWNDQAATARAICCLHAIDYACFDKMPVPTLCQDVYSSENFLQSIRKEM